MKFHGNICWFLARVTGNKSPYFFVARNVPSPLLVFVSLEISANVSRDLSLVFSYLTQVRRYLALPPAATATALAMFPRKRRTLEILARNVGSGGREAAAAVETHSGVGRAASPAGRHFISLATSGKRDASAISEPTPTPPSTSSLFVFLRSLVPVPVSPRPPSPPRCPPSSRLELPPTPPGAPSPSAPSLRRSPFASVRTTLCTPRHQAFPPPRRWCSSFQLVCDTRYAVNVTCTITVNSVVADALGSKIYRLKYFFSWRRWWAISTDIFSNHFSHFLVNLLFILINFNKY